KRDAPKEKMKDGVKVGYEKKEKVLIPSVIKTKKDFIDWLKLNDTVHELVTRRWTPEEIIKGSQVDKDTGTEYLLNTACYDSQLTKVDIYFSNESPLFIETTNVLMREKKDYEIETFHNELILEMLTRYYAKDNKLKALKRLYVLSRMDENVDMCLLLHDFTQRSLVSKYNTVVNNLKVFDYIIDRYGLQIKKNVNADLMTPYNDLICHMTEIQSRIQKMYEPYQEIYTKIINDINKQILDIFTDNLTLTREQIDKILKVTEHIREYFEKQIDILSTQFIKDNNIDFSIYIKYD